MSVSGGTDGNDVTEQSKEKVVALLQDCDDRCKIFVADFINCVFSLELCKIIAVFLKMLLGNRPVTSIIPFRSIGRVEEVMHLVFDDITKVSNLDSLHISPALTNLIKIVFQSTACIHANTVCKCIIYQCEFNRCQDKPQLHHTNTSICEQLNFHLHNFKYIANNLNQERFSFLLQLIIYDWNKKKTLLYKRLDEQREVNQAMSMLHVD